MKNIDVKYIIVDGIAVVVSSFILTTNIFNLNSAENIIQWVLILLISIRLMAGDIDSIGRKSK